VNDGTLERFKNTIYNFTIQRNNNPIIQIIPYQAIRLNFTDPAKKAIRNMTVKLWQTNESTSISNVSTNRLGSAIWFIPKRLIKAATNVFFF